MYCKKCGKEVEGNEVYCNDCKAQMEKSVNEPQQEGGLFKDIPQYKGSVTSGLKGAIIWYCISMIVFIATYCIYGRFVVKLEMVKTVDDLKALTLYTVLFTVVTTVLSCVSTYKGIEYIKHFKSESFAGRVKPVPTLVFGIIDLSNGISDILLNLVTIVVVVAVNVMARKG